jgi:hypothetical protein
MRVLVRRYRHLGIRRRLESRILFQATHQLDPIEEGDLLTLSNLSSRSLSP